MWCCICFSNRWWNSIKRHQETFIQLNIYQTYTQEREIKKQQVCIISKITWFFENSKTHPYKLKYMLKSVTWKLNLCRVPGYLFPENIQILVKQPEQFPEELISNRYQWCSVTPIKVEKKFRWPITGHNKVEIIFQNKLGFF